MNSSSRGSGGTSGSGSTSFFNGTASAEWGSGNSGNGGLNDGGAPPLVEPDIGTQPSGAPGTGGGVLGGVFLSSHTSGCLGCSSCGRYGNGFGDLIISMMTWLTPNLLCTIMKSCSPNWKKAEAISNRRKNILLVFDNCIGSVNWKAPIVDEVFSTHRHNHVSILVSTQYPNKLPTLI